MDEDEIEIDLLAKEDKMAVELDEIIEEDI